MSAPQLFYTAADSERAAREWKATCGPHAIAAACGLSLEAVRSALPLYKGWMSPTMVEQTLQYFPRKFVRTTGLKTQQLCEGINRVQWEGKWLNPGVPPRVAYHYTHWVAHSQGWVLCSACVPWEWIRANEWAEFVRKEIHPFHITHHYTLEGMST